MAKEQRTVSPHFIRISDVLFIVRGRRIARAQGPAMTLELTDDEAPTLIAYVRKKYGEERYPLSIELRPLREVLDKIDPRKPRPEVPATKYYAPPRGTAKQRRSFKST
jgi:hypothetical protein